MKRITDKQRMDFLERQHFTRWVGYTDPKGCKVTIPGHAPYWVASHTTWPVFPGTSFRDAVDAAMRLSLNGRTQHGD